MRALKRLGWYHADGWRWFRHSDDEGNDRKGLKSVEWSWKVGEYGPHLGFYFENGNTYSFSRRFYVGFLLGQVWFKWVAKTKNKRDNKRFGFEIGRQFFHFWWNADDHGRMCGIDDSGTEITVMWWDRFKDFMLGKQVCIAERGQYKNDHRKGVVSMPEGDYPAIFTFETRVWLRPRSPFRRIRRSTDVDIPIGIPCSGKGENSWDCGDDGLYGTGCEGHDIEKAAAHVAEVAAKLREKRGDPAKWPMSPEDRIVELEKMRNPAPTS